MSQVDGSRLETESGVRHSDGRPYHFPVLSQDSRIRRVFQVQEDAPLPLVNDHTLAAYYEHLLAGLALPFEALYCPTKGDLRQLIHYVRVTELIDPRTGTAHNIHGLHCRAQNTKEVLDLPLADLGVRDENPNCQLLDDYAYWFVNWR
jgi:hypothetical protein